MGRNHNAKGPGRHDWETPTPLFRRFHDLFHFKLDAAANPANAKLPRYLTDAFHQDWNVGGAVFLNPPYDQLKAEPWMRRAADAGEHHTVLVLIPARTETAWFR
jgi:phage N-6-adenine-methyltransferase